MRSASFTAIDAPLIVGISYDPYRHYLFKAGEMHGIQLLAVHNVRFMVRLLQSIREALRQGRFAEARRQWLG